MNQMKKKKKKKLKLEKQVKKVVMIVNKRFFTMMKMVLERH